MATNSEPAGAGSVAVQMAEGAERSGSARARGLRLAVGVLSRLATGILVMLGASILIFFVARVMPGDPARIALGPTATPEQVAALRAERYLDEPIAIQYLHFLRDLLHGDLGRSLYTNRPVVQDVLNYLPATIELMLAAGLLMIMIGLPLGIASARWKGRLPDHWIRLFSFVLISTPAFVWAVLLQLSFGYALSLFPIEGRLLPGLPEPERVTGLLLVDSVLAADWAVFFDAAQRLVLPALALAMPAIGQTMRMLRANMSSIYETPYIEMARAFGIGEGKIARQHVFRPAMVPTLTVMGLDFAAMLGSAFLVERIFGWPGLSRYGVEVILRKDLDAIVAVVLVIAFAFLVVNALVDLLVASFNPRIRRGRPS